MKYGYKEVRKLSNSNLRELCIEHDWYTGGTNEEYKQLMKRTEKENITTDDIVEITEDIIEHSHIHPDYTFTDVMFAVGLKCTTHFEEC